MLSADHDQQRDCQERERGPNQEERLHETSLTHHSDERTAHHRSRRTARAEKREEPLSVLDVEEAVSEAPVDRVEGDRRYDRGELRPEVNRRARGAGGREV